MTRPQTTEPPASDTALGLVVARIPAEATFKDKAYAALKDAIVKMDIYRTNEAIRLDERELSDRLGVSRTPIREAIAVLEREGFVKTIPRRGIHVVRKTKREIIEMVQAWAALESMAARLGAARAPIEEIRALRTHVCGFDPRHVDQAKIGEYSSANIAFHQSVIRLAHSQLLTELTDNLFIHVRAIRHRTIFEADRAQRSIRDHADIIDALEARDGETAERLVREHTLRLADHVLRHVDID